MDKIFSLDSPVMRFLGRMSDLLILNFLVMVCCIPVITAGAAFTGMYYVLMKTVRGEEGYLVSGFFKSFKQNFKQATALWLLILLFIVVCVGDILVFKYSTLEFPQFLQVTMIAVAILVAMVAVYIFPVLARFDNTTKNTIRNAFFMSIMNLPKTILIVLLLCSPVVVAMLSPYLGAFVFMFGISLPAYASAYFFSGIFKRFEPEEEVEASDYEFSINTDEGNEEKNE
ncbi:MAG: DUF624 domain-containing protein [Muribaculaceae bacterium]|nr:DUF624 domain-containing protein [Muribaculaceae bacterium]